MKIKLVLLNLGLVMFCQFANAQVPSYVPTNGLVGYWPFNGNANDVSSNTNNGINNGATLTIDRFGISNSAYSFNGGVNFINVASNSSLDFSLNNKISISFWMYSTIIPNANEVFVLISKQDSAGTTQKGFNVANELSATYLLVKNGISSAQAYSGIAGSNFNNGVWYNLVFIYDNGITKAYKNGVLINEGFTSTVIGSSTQPLRFGKPSWAAQNIAEYNGKLDDIGIWNRALTQDEIISLYQAEVSCQSLVINSGTLSSFNPPVYQSTVTIYPNPANDQITIDCGNLANVAGWSIKIVNAIGQEVFSGAMNTPQYVVPLNSWSGQGMYFVKIYDAANNLVNTKKIILQ
ncbi:MAG: LamG-like jellyroll fold domain-containing protein [Flavobacterium psychrophilum]